MLGYYHEYSAFGPQVKVIRTLQTGDQVEEELPASFAVESVLDDPMNGTEVKSARIKFGWLMDVWGRSA